ncbi:hypothetical protein FSO04_19780 [Paraburkholderia madseniana]|uniref:Uncharacterized protein n=1 Tax=Paraburkholderia madseniana TaxID=2599607 RepID=A0A6N6WDU2_9BURK|nr:hypothetical protein [Paraburkholderia madseniana]KAE8758169.1 hypothetical protein FSO04_19780 [Paraburkholderia madseniana]
MQQVASSAELPVAQAGGLDQKGSSSARWLVSPSVSVLVITVVVGAATRREILYQDRLGSLVSWPGLSRVPGKQPAS